MLPEDNSAAPEEKQVSYVQQDIDMFADEAPTSNALAQDIALEESISAKPEPTETVSAGRIDMQKAVLIRVGYTGESMSQAIKSVTELYNSGNKAVLTEEKQYKDYLKQTVPQAVGDMVAGESTIEGTRELLDTGAEVINGIEATTQEEAALETSITAITSDPIQYEIMKKEAAVWQNYKYMEQKIEENGGLEGVEFAKDAVATFADLITGFELRDLYKIGEHLGFNMGLSTDLGGLLPVPVGTWTLDFEEQWRNWITGYQTLPAEQQRLAFQSLADILFEEQTSLSAVMMLDNLLSFGSQAEHTGSLLAPYSPALMTLDQVLGVGFTARIGKKLFTKSLTAGTPWQMTAAMGDSKKAYDMLVALERAPEKARNAALGGRTNSSNIAGSVDPVAGATSSTKVPVVITRESAARFHQTVKDMAVKGELGLDNVDETMEVGDIIRMMPDDLADKLGDMVAAKHVLEDTLSVDRLRQVTLFETAFNITQDMPKAVKRAFNESLRNANDTIVVDDIQLVMNEAGAWEGQIKVAISSSDIPLTGRVRSKPDGTLVYEPSDSRLERVEMPDFHLKFDDIQGEYTGLGRGWKETPLGQFLLSPNASITDAHGKTVVQAAIRLDGTSQELANQFTAGLDFAMKPLKQLPLRKRSKATDRLIEVLTEGDEWKDATGAEVGIEFDRMTLKVKYGLGEPEIQAYYNIRTLAKQLGEIKNAELRKMLLSKGYRNIILPPIKGSKGRKDNLGRPLERLDELRSQPNMMVYNSDTGADIMSADLLKMTDELKDYKVVRMHSGSMRGINPEHANRAYKYVLVKKSNITDLPMQVTTQKAGWMPRAHDRALYYVRQFDEEGNYVRAVRYFDNEPEARLFADDLSLGKHGGSKGHRYVAQSEGDFLRQNPEEGFLNGVGGLSDGLYTSARASRRLEFGHPDYSVIRGAGRIDVMKTLKGQMSAMATHIPRNEWRMGEEQRLRNSIRKMMGDQVADAWGGLRDPIPQVGDRVLATALENRRKHLEVFAGMRDSNETFYHNMMQFVYEWSVAPATGITQKVLKATHLDKPVSFLAWKAYDSDPISFMRSVAFHSLLGAGRIDQAWVQAQGASIAVSIDPLNVARNITLQSRMNSVALMNRSQFDAYAKHTLLKNPDDVWEATQLYRRSGLLAGIETNADMRAVEKGYGVGMGAVRKMLDVGLIPYRAGERFNRGVSFASALGEYQSGRRLLADGTSLKGVPLSKYSDEALKAITARANNLMLNLNKGNAAAWQSGVLSLPTQFLQVQAKIFEEIFTSTGNFTAGERVRLLLGQGMLYGPMTGVPFGGTVLNHIAQTYFEDEQQFMEFAKDNKELERFIYDGFWGYTVYMATGGDLSLGKRGSIVSSIEEVIRKGVATDDMDVSDWVLGASGVGVGQAVNLFQNLKFISMGAIVEKDVRIEHLKEAASAFGRIAASFSAAERAIYLHKTDALLNTKYKTIIAKDQTLATEIGMLMGFTAADANRVWDLKEAVQAEKKVDAAIQKEIVSMSRQMLVSLVDAQNKGEQLSAEDIETWQARVHGTLLLAYGDDKGKIDQMRKNILNALADPKTDAEKALSEYINTAASHSAQSAFNWVESHVSYTELKSENE